MSARKLDTPPGVWAEWSGTGRHIRVRFGFRWWWMALRWVAVHVPMPKPARVALVVWLGKMAGLEVRVSEVTRG